MSNVPFISLKAMKAVFTHVSHMVTLLYLLTEAVNRKRWRGNLKMTLIPKKPQQNGCEVV